MDRVQNPNGSGSIRKSWIKFGEFVLDRLGFRMRVANAKKKIVMKVTGQCWIAFFFDVNVF